MIHLDCEILFIYLCAIFISVTKEVTDKVKCLYLECYELIITCFIRFDVRTIQFVGLCPFF